MKGGLRMESKAKLMGHPVHPMLIVFPLGLLAGSLGFDIGYMATNDAELATVSFWMIGAGILGGLLAAVFGVVDWVGIPKNTRAKAVGLWHGLGNVLVVLLFAISWWLRSGATGHVPPGAAFTISCCAVALALLTGWLGGELVDRLGVGVDEGAHLNAPNSLSRRPASEDARDHRNSTQHPSRA
jgi:uncharacterized membrane protein